MQLLEVQQRLAQPLSASAMQAPPHSPLPPAHQPPLAALVELPPVSSGAPTSLAPSRRSSHKHRWLPQHSPQVWTYNKNSSPWSTNAFPSFVSDCLSCSLQNSNGYYQLDCIYQHACALLVCHGHSSRHTIHPHMVACGSNM